jgi:hypothetical protein
VVSERALLVERAHNVSPVRLRGRIKKVVAAVTDAISEGQTRPGAHWHTGLVPFPI